MDPDDRPPTAILKDTPRTPYRRRKGEKKTTLHWGQRKLLMSEIQFLTEHAGSGDGNAKHTVVYAGAAPGTHMKYLSDLFPDVKFVLVDPNPFAVAASEKITVVNAYFSTKLAKEYRASIEAEGRRALFVSDIRTADWKTQSPVEYLKYLNADNAAQAEWHSAVNAEWSMLKFSLPYTAGTTEYLEGDVLLPVWGPQTTTECRLVVAHGCGTTSYDHKRHEEVMFHFNTVTRVAPCPPYEIYDGVGYDHRYDCAREIDILSAYLTAHRPQDEPLDAVPEMSAAISKQLSSRGYTLATHPLCPFLLPRDSSNPDGQKPRKVREVAVRATPHPCSNALTEAHGGGAATAAHGEVVQGNVTGRAVVMVSVDKVRTNNVDQPKDAEEPSMAGTKRKLDQ